MHFLDMVNLKRKIGVGIINQRVVIHPFIPSMANKVEKWLEEMAIKGWELVRFSGWRFFFKKSKPQKRIYLISLHFDKSKGISYDYYRVKELYGKSKAIINKAYCEIFEADESKIDYNFYLFKRIRNKYYKKHYLKLSIFSFVSILLSLHFWRYIFLLLTTIIPSLFAFVYSIVSLFIILKTDAILKNHQYY